MTDEQAAALALLYLRMDDENKQTFYLYCFEQVNDAENETLRQITDNNLDQLLALTALQHVAQLTIVDKYGNINWTKDVVLIPKKELSPECLEITFDHDNYTCTVTYKDRGAERRANQQANSHRPI